MGQILKKYLHDDTLMSSRKQYTMVMNEIKYFDRYTVIRPSVCKEFYGSYIDSLDYEPIVIHIPQNQWFNPSSISIHAKITTTL